MILYGTLLNFAKKLRRYASREFKKNNMHLFLKGFKELIEKLNNRKYNKNIEEIEGFESICDFINLIPLEIEILYKKILSMENDNNNNIININNNIKYNSIKKNDIKNKEKIKNNNENSHISNAFSDISQNKKSSKYIEYNTYKNNENTLFFRNKEIKIKKLNIAELSNIINNPQKKTIQNQNVKNRYLETHKNESENKSIKKSNINLYTETIKSSRSDNFQKLFDKKNSFNTLQSGGDNENENEIKKKGGINLKKKFSFNENSEENHKNTNLTLKKQDNTNKEILSSRRKVISNERKDGASSLANQTDTKDKDNLIKNKKEKNSFKSIRNKLINSELKLKNSIKKSAPQQIWYLQNEGKNKNKNNKDKKNDNSLPGTIELTNNNQNFAYRKKILHKINNFSVNVKNSRKNAISFNSSISFGKKKNNSFLFN